MKFEWFFFSKIFNKKENKKQISFIIVFITQIALILGIVVAEITFSIGMGAKKILKEKLSDFSSHITLKKLDGNHSFDSSAILLNQELYLDKFSLLPKIDHVNTFALKSGILRNKEGVEGILFKGISKAYNLKTLKKFIIKGEIPDFSKDYPSNQIILSKKIAQLLHLKVGDKVNAFFFMFQANKHNIKARNFLISGLYETGVKNFDDHFIIGDIRQVQHINNWSKDQVGGVEIFLKDIDQITEVKESLEEKMPSYIQVESFFSRFDSIISWIRVFDLNIFITLGIVALVIMINMMVLLLVLILERIPKIGILKTLGTSNKSIGWIFFFYSLKIMLPSFFIANIISITFLFFQDLSHFIKLDATSYYINYLPVYINIPFILFINFFYLGVCSITMIFTYFFISKISPIKALKFD